MRSSICITTVSLPRSLPLIFAEAACCERRLIRRSGKASVTRCSQHRLRQPQLLSSHRFIRMFPSLHIPLTPTPIPATFTWLGQSIDMVGRRCGCQPDIIIAPWCGMPPGIQDIIAPRCGMDLCIQDTSAALFVRTPATLPGQALRGISAAASQGRLAGSPWLQPTGISSWPAMASTGSAFSSDSDCWSVSACPRGQIWKPP
jgi:hypothetical protein